MNTATEHPVSPRRLEHFAALATAWGRSRQRLEVRRRRLAWRWIASGAESAKRGVDLIGSLTALALLSPVFVAIALLITLEDGGPVFFRQIRVGRFGREFCMLKFRSMRIDAEQRLRELLAKNQHTHGVTFKIKDDPRITRVGRFIRKYSLDELPQLYNVLTGEMSLVGPRPPVPREVALYSLGDRRRLAVKPGLTCLWQISGRAKIDFPGQVQLDVRYIENGGLAEDVRILCKTVPAVISGDGAY